jgi:hypothetical protein
MPYIKSASLTISFQWWCQINLQRNCRKYCIGISGFKAYFNFPTTPSGDHPHFLCLRTLNPFQMRVSNDKALLNPFQVSKERTVWEIDKVDLFRVIVNIYSKERSFKDKNRVCWATYKVEALLGEKRNLCSDRFFPSWTRRMEGTGDRPLTIFCCQARWQRIFGQNHKKDRTAAHRMLRWPSHATPTTPDVGFGLKPTFLMKSR